MGSNNYHTDQLQFKKDDIIRTTLSYAHKATGKGNDVIWSRVLYFKFEEVGGSCTVQTFFDTYIEKVIDKLKMIQSSVVRYNSIKLESVNQTTTQSIQFPLSGIYGSLNAMADVMKGFQIDLLPSKGGPTKRIYIRGTPDVLNIYDHTSNSELKQHVEDIERVFIESQKTSIEPQTDSKNESKSEVKNVPNQKQSQKPVDPKTNTCSFRFCVPSTIDTQGYEFVGSASAIKLHLFKKRSTPSKGRKNKARK